MEASTSKIAGSSQPQKMNIPDSLPDDSESELEALFELNMDAAYGELPIETLPTGTILAPEDDVTPDIVPIEDDPAPSSNKSLQNVPVADTAAISKVPEKQKKQSVKAQKRPRNHIPDVTSLPFTLASAEEEELPELGLRIRTNEGSETDKEAVDALLGGLTPFIVNDHGPRTDIVYPVALPLPSTTSTDTSALREFRKDMRRRHLNQDKSRLLDNDLIRLFDELRDGQGFHLQLPALAFDSLNKTSLGDNPFYAPVATLQVDPSSSHVMHLNSYKSEQKQTVEFDIVQHNVPTFVTELFSFRDSREKEGTNGVVTSQKVNLALSISGRVSMANTTDDEFALAKRRNAALERIAATKKPSEASFPENKRKTVTFSSAIFKEHSDAQQAQQPLSPTKRAKVPLTV